MRSYAATLTNIAVTPEGWRNGFTSVAETLDVKRDCVTRRSLTLLKRRGGRHTTRKVREVGGAARPLTPSITIRYRRSVMVCIPPVG